MPAYTSTYTMHVGKHQNALDQRSSPEWHSFCFRIFTYIFLKKFFSKILCCFHLRGHTLGMKAIFGPNSESKCVCRNTYWLRVTCILSSSVILCNCIVYHLIRLLRYRCTIPPSNTKVVLRSKPIVPWNESPIFRLVLHLEPYLTGETIYQKSEKIQTVSMTYCN